MYLAVQDSTERRVAIKVLNRGRVGSSAVSLARFEREVEALSLLKHPNIVTIHDCGRDHEQVYLVMDYVDGRPVDVFVRERGLSEQHKLELFAKICDGVSAAHLRGIIHRDLKPGNILVDERGEPHVLDFGLAKISDTSISNVMTETGQFVGSLPWASPEQAGGRTEELDVRTDVYSLGVLLYQMLTGTFPYPVTGAMVDVARHIAFTEPARPSTVGGQVSRDLETVLLKCLAKEADRRYQSAGEVARDIRRVIEGAPVEARRDSLAYLMTRRLARYRVAAITSLVILIGVSGGLVAALHLWRQSERSAKAAQQAAGRADREAMQARSVIEFMRGVLTSVQPENQGADVRLIQVLGTASQVASAQFGSRPESEAEVRELLGQVYDSLAMWNESTSELQQAAALWERGAGADAPRTIECRCLLVNSLLNCARVNEAEAQLKDLEERTLRVLGADHIRSLDVRRNMAVVRQVRGQVAEAEQMLLELRSRKDIAENDEAQVRVLSALVNVLISRSTHNDEQVRLSYLRRADALMPEWIERSTRVVGARAVPTLQAKLQSANLASQLGRFAEAAAMCRELLDGSEQRLGMCHPVRSRAKAILAEAIAGLGEHAQAADLILQRLQCTRQEQMSEIMFMSEASDALRYLERGNRGAEGESLARELASMLAKFGGGHDDMNMNTQAYIAAFVSMQGRGEEADKMFSDLAARRNEVLEKRARARLMALYGAHLTRRGRFAEAERELQAAADCLGDIRIGTLDTHPDDVVQMFIDLYTAWGNSAKAAEFVKMQRGMLRR